MTDARIPERYLNDRRIVRLTHAQRSSYFMATLWSVSNRTDGKIAREDLPLIPTFDRSTVDILVNSGLWAITEAGWVDTEFERVQSSSDELDRMDKMRRADRDSKARRRAHNKGDHSLCRPDTCSHCPSDSPRDKPSFKPSPGDGPSDMSGGPNRLGEDRTGEERLITGELSETEARADSSGDVLGEVDDMRVDSRTGEVVDLPAGSPMALAAGIRAELRATDDPDYCRGDGGCGMTLVNGVCPRCSKKKERAA